MKIVRKATKRQYQSQPIPRGWVIPPLEFGCDHLYEVDIIGDRPAQTTGRVAEQEEETLP